MVLTLMCAYAGIWCKEVCTGGAYMAARTHHSGIVVHPNLSPAVLCQANPAGDWTGSNCRCNDINLHSVSSISCTCAVCHLVRWVMRRQAVPNVPTAACVMHQHASHSPDKLRCIAMQVSLQCHRPGQHHLDMMQVIRDLQFIQVCSDVCLLLPKCFFTVHTAESCCVSLIPCWLDSAQRISALSTKALLI